MATMKKRFSELTPIDSAMDAHELLIHNGDGVKKITTKDFKKDLVALVEATAVEVTE